MTQILTSYQKVRYWDLHGIVVVLVEGPHVVWPRRHKPQKKAMVCAASLTGIHYGSIQALEEGHGM